MSIDNISVYYKLRKLWDRNIHYIKNHISRLVLENNQKKEKIKILTVYLDEYNNQNKGVVSSGQLKVNKNFCNNISVSIEQLHLQIKKSEAQIINYQTALEQLNIKLDTLNDMIERKELENNRAYINQEYKAIEALFNSLSLYKKTS